MKKEKENKRKMKRRKRKKKNILSFTNALNADGYCNGFYSAICFSVEDLSL